MFKDLVMGDNPAWQSFQSGFFGGFVGAFVALGLIVAFILFIAIYAYAAIALSTIARKLRHPNPWIAWIPFANMALVLQLGGFHWAWIFLLLIPILGWVAVWVLLIIASWRMFAKRKYPGWMALSLVLPQIGIILYLIALGFAAWGRR